MNKIIKNISSIKVQGATKVAFTSLLLVKNSLRKLSWPPQKKSFDLVADQAGLIGRLRSTEPLTRNLIRWLLLEAFTIYKKNNNRENFNKYLNALYNRAIGHYADVEDSIVRTALKKINDGDNVFTHCHSSLVEKILIAAKQSGKKITVYHTETRPLFQGRITEKNLRKAGVKSFMVADSAAAYLVSKHSGDDISIDLVVLGADALLADGSVINKIGSFGIALAAYDSKIPVYVASSLLKFDIDSTTKIEMRSSGEIWPNHPSKTRILNYAFDRIPAKMITEIICENGAVKPKSISKLAKKQYAKLFNY